MSSEKAPSEGVSESGSSRRHSMDTICQPAAVRYRITSELNGSATTSRMRSKYAMGASEDTTLLNEGAIFGPESFGRLGGEFR